eukprot:scaffold3170_cov128-Cylindrotheca_fusiformis.AAC.17
MLIHCAKEATIGSGMRKAIMLNNLATPSIQRGEYKQSIRKLSTALKLLKVEMNQRSCTKSNGLDVLSCGILTALVRHMSDSFCSSSSSSTSTSVYIKDDFRVFIRALQFPPKAPTNPQTCELVALTVMFNLALSHQLLAAQLCGKKSLLCLDKALRLYQLCCKLQILAEPDLQRSLLPAIINNMGIAQFKMQLEEEAAISFEWIVSIALSTTANGEDAHRMNWTISVFLENAFHVLHKRSVPAPAA